VFWGEHASIVPVAGSSTCGISEWARPVGRRVQPELRVGLPCRSRAPGGVLESAGGQRGAAACLPIPATISVSAPTCRCGERMDPVAISRYGGMGRGTARSPLGGGEEAPEATGSESLVRHHWPELSPLGTSGAASHPSTSTTHGLEPQPQNSEPTTRMHNSHPRSENRSERPVREPAGRDDCGLVARTGRAVVRLLS
jgi:hypothetical protein